MNRDRGRTPLVEMASSLSLILFALGGLLLVLRWSSSATPSTAPSSETIGPPPLVGNATPVSISVQFPDRLTMITETPPTPTPTPYQSPTPRPTPTPYQSPTPQPTQPSYCPQNPDTLPVGSICQGPPPQPPTPTPMPTCRTPPEPTLLCVVQPASPTPTPVTDRWPLTR